MNEQKILDVIFPIISNDSNVKVPSSEKFFNTFVGPGDDAAIINVSSDSKLVVSTDTLTEHYDFRFLWNNGYTHQGFDLGWKTIVHNTSDIAAMNGVAQNFTISLSIPSQKDFQWIISFAHGIRAALDCYSHQLGTHLSVVGGDLSAAHNVSITTTVLGAIDKKKITHHKIPRRHRAEEGSYIALGPGKYPLGAAHISWQLLEGKISAPYDINIKTFAPQLMPEPELSQVRDRDFVPLSLVDISDGLLHEIKLLLSSQTPLVLAVPNETLTILIDSLQRWYADNGIDIEYENARNAVLCGGEDQLLLGAFADQEQIPEDFVLLGQVQRPEEVSSQENLTVHSESQENGGFDHFEK